jgi:hypothetical protein
MHGAKVKKIKNKTKKTFALQLPSLHYNCVFTPAVTTVTNSILQNVHCFLQQRYDMFFAPALPHISLNFPQRLWSQS